MADNSNQTKLLQLSSLPKIHLSDPHIGKALQDIVDYINKNVAPKKGTASND